jgi:hypothetical protein
MAVVIERQMIVTGEKNGFLTFTPGEITVRHVPDMSQRGLVFGRKDTLITFRFGSHDDNRK